MSEASLIDNRFLVKKITEISQKTVDDVKNMAFGKTKSMHDVEIKDNRLLVAGARNADGVYLYGYHLRVGDYVIRNSDGMLHGCTADAFDKIYIVKK